MSPAWDKKLKLVLDAIGTGYLFALVGPRGTGKTQLSANVIAASARVERVSLYVRAMEIFLRIRSTYSQENLSELDAIEELRKPQLLVVDEVQQRAETDFENRLLAYLLDCRYGDMSDTILIANQTPEALTDSLDSSIVDRLREAGGIIECNWASFRGPAAQSVESGA